MLDLPLGRQAESLACSFMRLLLGHGGGSLWRIGVAERADRFQCFCGILNDTAGGNSRKGGDSRGGGAEPALGRSGAVP
jgi:hypothetical protein